MENFVIKEITNLYVAVDGNRKNLCSKKVWYESSIQVETSAWYQYKTGISNKVERHMPKALRMPNALRMTKALRMPKAPRKLNFSRQMNFLRPIKNPIQKFQT